MLREAGAQPIALVRREADVARLGPALTALSPVLLSTDVEEMTRRLAACGADSLVNCITNYGRGGEPAAALVEANLLVPLLLLEAADRAGLGLMLSVGSALPRHTNLYALTKTQLVEAATVFPRRRLRFCNARCEMFFGPGEPDSKKLPTHLIRSLAAGVDVIKMSPGDQRRDFLYVDDLASALAHLLAHEAGGDAGVSAYDIGSGAPVSIRTFAETVKRLAGAETELVFGAFPYRANEAMDVSVDPGPLKALGWSSEVSLDEGVRRALAAEPGMAGTNPSS